MQVIAYISSNFRQFFPFRIIFSLRSTTGEKLEACSRQSKNNILLVMYSITSSLLNLPLRKNLITYAALMPILSMALRICSQTIAVFQAVEPWITRTSLAYCFRRASVAVLQKTKMSAISTLPVLTNSLASSIRICNIQKFNCHGYIIFLMYWLR